MFVGIDVSKERLDVSVHGRKESWQFSRDESGLAQGPQSHFELLPHFVEPRFVAQQLFFGRRHCVPEEISIRDDLVEQTPRK